MRPVNEARSPPRNDDNVISSRQSNRIGVHVLLITHTYTNSTGNTWVQARSITRISKESTMRWPNLKICTEICMCPCPSLVTPSDTVSRVYPPSKFDGVQKENPHARMRMRMLRCKAARLIGSTNVRNFFFFPSAAMQIHYYT